MSQLCYGCGANFSRKLVQDSRLYIFLLILFNTRAIDMQLMTRSSMSRKPLLWKTQTCHVLDVKLPTVAPDSICYFTLLFTMMLHVWAATVSMYITCIWAIISKTLADDLCIKGNQVLNKCTYITGHIFVVLHHLFIASIDIKHFPNSFGCCVSLLKNTELLLQSS